MANDLGRVLFKAPPLLLGCCCCADCSSLLSWTGMAGTLSLKIKST
jgi:hypothetical protein